MPRRTTEENGSATAEEPPALSAPEAPPEPAPDAPEDDRPNMPVYVARYSLIRACVWANASERGTRYTTTLSRLYLGADDRWHSTQSFGYRDLPLVEKVAADAFGWIAEKYAQQDVPF